MAWLCWEIRGAKCDKTQNAKYGHIMRDIGDNIFNTVEEGLYFGDSNDDTATSDTTDHICNEISLLHNTHLGRETILWRPGESLVSVC